MLTRKQYDLLMFIHKRVRRDGVSPSFDEMKEALDLRSKSGIHRLVTALEERGFIRRLAHRARAVEIIRLPENVEDTRPNRGGFRPSVIEGDLGRGADPFGRTSVQLGMERIGQAPDAAPDATPNATDVPLIGRIAAGAPIEALEHGPSHLGVPSSMLSASAARNRSSDSWRRESRSVEGGVAARTISCSRAVRITSGRLGASWRNDSRSVQGSIRVPPQEEWMRPMGTSSSSCSRRPKK